MNNIKQADAECALYAEDISDDDIFEAMKEVSGYIDITLEDFRDIYRHAYRHAHNKVTAAGLEVRMSSAEIPESEAGGENSAQHDESGLLHVVKKYFKKMRGSEHSPPRVSLKETVWSWIGAFVGIALVSYFNIRIMEQSDMILLVASFGASAVLIYGAVKSPLAQPRNLIGGHMLSALVGVVCYQYFYFNPWFASALAVASAVALMHVTRTLHPPGGATALIAVIGSEQIHSLGYLYVLIPVGLGALVMLIVALLVNNISRTRRYPEFWL
jgi:CBS-domain-containing membrane protein